MDDALTAGDIDVLEPGVVHMGGAADGKAWSCRCLYISGQLLEYSALDLGEAPFSRLPVPYAYYGRRVSLADLAGMVELKPVYLGPAHRTHAAHTCA
jgi:AraC-like ligand binding domain